MWRQLSFCSFVSFFFSFLSHEFFWCRVHPCTANDRPVTPALGRHAFIGSRLTFFSFLLRNWQRLEELPRIAGQWLMFVWASDGGSEFEQKRTNTNESPCRYFSVVRIFLRRRSVHSCFHCEFRDACHLVQQSRYYFSSEQCPLMHFLSPVNNPRWKVGLLR